MSIKFYKKQMSNTSEFQHRIMLGRVNEANSYWLTLTSLLRISQRAMAATANRFSLARGLAV